MESRFQCAICGQRLKTADYLCATCQRDYGDQWWEDWLQALLDEELERRAQIEQIRQRFVDVTDLETEAGFADDIEDLLEYSAPRYRTSVEDHLQPRLSHKRLLAGGVDITPYEQKGLQGWRCEIDD